jgi:hypothetical protein
MKNETLEQQVSRIADAIVELVERTNGPVTLAQVGREVAGFTKDDPPFWAHLITHASGETSFWYDMTEAGLAAFRQVMNGRRVAVQFVNMMPYLLEGYLIENEKWQPIMLLPAKAANVESPKYLLRYPLWCLEHIASRAAAGESPSRPLSPTCYVGATADQFFAVNTGELESEERYSFDLSKLPFEVALG